MKQQPLKSYKNKQLTILIPLGSFHKPIGSKLKCAGAESLAQSVTPGMSNSNYIAGRKSIKNCLKGRKSAQRYSIWAILYKNR